MKRISAFLFALALLAGLAVGAGAIAGTEAGATAGRDAGATFFFVQLSDPQFGFFSGDSDYAQETANLEFAIATLNRLRPAFVVVTGDLVNKAGDAAQIGEYRRIVARLDPAIPIYHVAGNHDVGNVPTPESLEAYRRALGPDHYVFRHDGFVGIVVNSCLFAAPQAAPGQAKVQEAWLVAELARARADGARHAVVFSHHPLFIGDAGEPDAYVNVPRTERDRLLDLLSANRVRFFFAGHHHQNALARAGDLEVVTTGPIGRPLGEGRSGMRIVTVTDAGITHRYYDLSELPNAITLPR